jgi:hypothetical protein
VFTSKVRTELGDNMPRQSGTIDVARRPPMPDAHLQEKEGEPKVHMTPCQEDGRDEACVYTGDMPGTRLTYDMEPAAATIANYSNTPVTRHDAKMHAVNTYKYETTDDKEVIATDDEEVIATDYFAANDEGFVAATLAVYKEENVAVDTIATNNKDTYDEESPSTALAAYDDETAAVEGEPWGA